MGSALAQCVARTSLVVAGVVEAGFETYPGGIPSFNKALGLLT